MRKIFVNLTNGIEYLEHDVQDVSFIRIQSTLCEQTRWDYLLMDLDYNFLMNLAVGNECVVVDYGSRSGHVPRSVWQGLEFIKYFLNRVWFKKEYVPFVRKTDVSNYFKSEYDRIRRNRRLMARYKYFIKFLHTDELKLDSICKKTEHDGDSEYYNAILKEWKGKHNRKGDKDE